uniref:hypothetical protein n=1 Tax=Gemmiger formicilis TaxID=745368 RepID=UPI004026D1E6
MDEFLPYSPTKQKEPLTWVEVSGKTKALTQSGNRYEKGAVAHVTAPLLFVESKNKKLFFIHRI